MTTCQLSSIGQKSLLLILSLYPLTHTSVTLFPSLSACLSFSAPVSQLFKQTLSLSLSPSLSHINNVTKCISVFKPWQGPSVTFLFNNKHKKRGTERPSEGDSVCVQHRNENDMPVECITLALTYLVWPTQQFLLPSVCKQPHISGSQWTHWVQSGTSYMSTLRVIAYLRIYLGFGSYTFNYS